MKRQENGIKSAAFQRPPAKPSPAEKRRQHCLTQFARHQPCSRLSPRILLSSSAGASLLRGDFDAKNKLFLLPSFLRGRF